MFLLHCYLSIIGVVCCAYNILSEPATTSNRMLFVRNSNSTNFNPNLQFDKKGETKEAKINHIIGKTVTQLREEMKLSRTKKQSFIPEIYDVKKSKSKYESISSQNRNLKEVIMTQNAEKASILKKDFLKSYFLMRTRQIQNLSKIKTKSKKRRYSSYEEENRTALPDLKTVIKEIYLDKNESDFKSIHELCEQFEIPIENCSCNNDFIIAVLKSLDIPITREICHINETIPTPMTYELVFDKLASQIYATITMVLIPVAFFGNCLVIFVNKNKQKLSRYEFLTTQLAVYDIIYTLIKAILTVPSFKTNHWVFDDVSCIVLPSLMKICWFLGVGLTTIIAIERFTGIMYPFRHAKNRSLIFMSSINIAFAFLTAFPLSWRLKIDKHFQVCTDLWVNSSSEIIYSIFLLIVYSIIPTILILTIYFMLIANLKSQIRKNALGFKKSSLQRRKRVQQNIRITNVLLVTIVLYALTTLPQRSISLYHLLNNQTGKKFMKISFLALLPYPFHLAINPILYSMIDAKWRKDCKKLLRKVFRIK